jgi:hypothetical protein
MVASAEVNCRKASRLLSEACERPLAADELKALQFHLGKCLMCRNFESQLQFLHKASKRFGTGAA